MNKTLESLERLEKIDNAEPSEALEELKELHELAYGNEETSWKIDEIRMSSRIKQALIKAEKEHKLLEIIKEKVMNLVSISDGRVWDGELYQSNKLTEEESVLLKEWENEKGV